MQIKSILMAGAVAGLAMGAALPASAQSAAEQIRAQQQQIDYMKRQIQLMQDKLTSLQATTQETKAQVATAVVAPKPAPHVTESGSHKFALESADGQYSIGLTGRIHADVGDYVNFDPKSKEVGPQNLNSGFNLRRARIGVTGKAAGDWTYGFIYDGGGTTDAAASGIQTAQIGYTGFKNTVIEFGYSDTFFTLDEATSSNDMLFMERATPGVAATGVNTGDFRSNFGARYFDDRLWLGAYVTGPSNLQAHGVGESVGAYQRAAYQVLSTPDYSLHLGVGIDEILKAPGSGPGTANTFTISDRPELRVDPTALVSTGALGVITNGVNHSISGGYIADVEFAAGYGPLFAQAEYLHYNIDRIGLATASFDGEYGEIGYTLTGESRKYKKDAGAYSGITPAHDFSPANGYWGAWEVAGRVSYIDLTSNFTAGIPISATSQPGAVNGGKETTFTAGLNWYPNTYMRVMLNYIHSDFEKANPATTTVAGIGTAVIGTPVGASLDAIAIRTQVAW